MESSELFVTASRLKLRFDSAKGRLSVEELWDLPLTSARGASLDNIAKALNAQILAESVESFVEPVTHGATALNTKFEIVKYVIALRLKINAANASDVKQARINQTILGVIADKENEELKGKTLEELKAMVK